MIFFGPGCFKDIIGYLGGGFKDFWNFHPDPWGFMIQFEEHIFQMGW